MSVSAAQSTAGDSPSAPSEERLPATGAVTLIGLALASSLVLGFWDQMVAGAAAICLQTLGDSALGAKCLPVAGKLLNLWRSTLFAFVFLLVVLLFERWRPVVRSQPLMSPGLLVDAFWCLLLPAWLLLLYKPLNALLDSTVGPAIAHLEMDLIHGLPLPAQLATAILLADLFAWLTHFTMHKVPFLWHFHKVHHAQQQINCMTTFRVHPGELLAIALLEFIPFTLLGLRLAVPAYLAWRTFKALLEMFYHSNIRTNFGPLRYVLVTPQSHRVHHSIEAEHFDCNFGNVFSFWDLLFRTQCLDFEVYPPSGVQDERCPRGRAASLGSALRMVARELRFPFENGDIPHFRNGDIPHFRGDEMQKRK